MIKKPFLVLLAVLIAAPLLFAQTALTTTTTSEVLDATEQGINIASTSGVTVGDIAVVDAEAMRVLSIGTNPTRIRVIRGVEGTKADDHATSSDIFIDPADRFIKEDLVGSCTVGNTPYAPVINLTTGRRYRCLESRWVLVWDGSGTLGETYATYAQGATVADAVSTIFYVAVRPMRVTDIDVIWDTAESSGAMNVQVQKLVGTEEIASGDDLLSAVVDATGTANTIANGSLSSTAAFLELAAGDSLAVELTATPNQIVGLTVTVRLVPDSN